VSWKHDKAGSVLKFTFDPHDGHVLLLERDDFAVNDDEFLLTTSALTPEP